MVLNSVPSITKHMINRCGRTSVLVIFVLLALYSFATISMIVTVLNATESSSRHISHIPFIQLEKAYSSRSTSLSYKHNKSELDGTGMQQRKSNPNPHTKLSKIHFDFMLKYGHVAGKKLGQGKKRLVIGISTVSRVEDYLSRTLDSLITESSEEERQDVVVVIHLADVRPLHNARKLALIKKRYRKYLECGFFQVIESSKLIYPPMDFVERKRTFNDSKARVLWRTKQVIDFTFIFTYSQPLAEYYLVLEDDVIAAQQYLTAIFEFMDGRKGKRWIALEFSGFLGIGLLFRTKDFPRLNQYFMMFYQNMPVDMLMRNFVYLEVPDKDLITRRIPSLFQHIGRKSTLKNKLQPVVDISFLTTKRRFRFRNPPARLVTTMKVHQEFEPELAYKPTPGYFWGVNNQNITQTLDIVFPLPLNISRILIISGVGVQAKKGIKMSDSIKDGHMEISGKFEKMSDDNRTALCHNYQKVASFKENEIDYNYTMPTDSDHTSSSTTDSFNSTIATASNCTTQKPTRQLKLPMYVQCIRVRIGCKQKTWIVIREIKVFASNVLG